MTAVPAGMRCTGMTGSRRQRFEPCMVTVHRHGGTGLLGPGVPTLTRSNPLESFRICSTSSLPKLGVTGSRPVSRSEKHALGGLQWEGERSATKPLEQLARHLCPGSVSVSLAIPERLSECVLSGIAAAGP
jgi:hypothetical protein